MSATLVVLADTMSINSKIAATMMGNRSGGRMVNLQTELAANSSAVVNIQLIKLFPGFSVREFNRCTEEMQPYGYFTAPDRTPPG